MSANIITDRNFYFKNFISKLTCSYEHRLTI